MPADMSTYAPYWHKLSRHIRHVRAGDCCEWCGVKNGRNIIRSGIDPEHYVYYDPLADCVYTYPNGDWIRMSELPSEFDGEPIRIILTVAHLDHDKTNNRFSNLAALCQRCHLNHDRFYHADNAQRTRAKKKHAARIAAGQLELF